MSVLFQTTTHGDGNKRNTRKKFIFFFDSFFILVPVIGSAIVVISADDWLNEMEETLSPGGPRPNSNCLSIQWQWTRERRGVSSKCSRLCYLVGRIFKAIRALCGVHSKTSAPNQFRMLFKHNRPIQLTLYSCFFF